MSEKTEKPSAKRLREARRKGQIPRSRLLSSSAVTLGGLLGFVSFAPEGFERLKEWTARLFLEAQPAGVWEEGLWLMGRLAGPALVGALLASLIVSVAMVGLELNTDHVMPKLERISPAAGLKRLFSVRPVIETAKALVVTAIVAVMVWSEVKESGPDALGAVWLEGTVGLSHLVARLAELATRIAPTTPISRRTIATRTSMRVNPPVVDLAFSRLSPEADLIESPPECRRSPCRDLRFVLVFPAAGPSR